MTCTFMILLPVPSTTTSNSEGSSSRGKCAMLLEPSCMIDKVENREDRQSNRPALTQHVK